MKLLHGDDDGDEHNDDDDDDDCNCGGDDGDFMTRSIQLFNLSIISWTSIVPRTKTSSQSAVVKVCSRGLAW